jgi:ABC-type uncharacterized transport system substrate-binding protein
MVLCCCLAVGCGQHRDRQPVVFGSPDSPRLRQVVAGLEAGLGGKPLQVVCVPELGGEGDAALARLRGQRPAAVIILGTAALIRFAPEEKHLPAVFALVGNPYFSGAAYEPGRPDLHQINITGLTSPAPVPAALEQGTRLLGKCPWGMLRDPLDGEGVEVAAAFTRVCRDLGLEALIENSTTTEGDQKALARLQSRGAKVFYLPPTASANRYGPRMLELGRQKKLKLVSSHPEMTAQGALLHVTLDYRRVGEEAAELVKRVLKGEAPAAIPIQESTPLRIGVDDRLLAYWCGYPGRQ